MPRTRAFAILPLAVLGLSAPAAAQIVGTRSYPAVGLADPFLPDSRLPGPSARQEAGQLRDRIGRAREAGLITRREARRLHRQADRIAGRAHIYGRDGLSSSEQAEIRARALAVESALSQAAVTAD